jgi:hypothetical protein
MALSTSGLLERIDEMGGGYSLPFMSLREKVVSVRAQLIREISKAEGEDLLSLFKDLVAFAEKEAKDCAVRINQRAEQSVTLAELVAKMVAAPAGDIDWSEDAEMKKLLDQARALGVDMPGYKFTEAERRVLREKILMHRDSMDRTTSSTLSTFNRFISVVAWCQELGSNELKARDSFSRKLIEFINVNN